VANVPFGSLTGLKAFVVTSALSELKAQEELISPLTGCGDGEDVGARCPRDPDDGPEHDIDIFGANCLGAADAWNQVRIGGALGATRRRRR